MKKLLAAFALLAFLGAVSAQCSGHAEHYLPAVVGSSGVLVNLSLELENGTGDVYLSIYPKAGLSTQDSIRTAMDYAFFETGRNRSACDVLIKAYLPDSTEGYIDGPSGGAALTIMGIAALEGRSIRDDAIITGAITSSGRIAPVGGLYEKAKIASEHGLKYFVTPTETLYERILLRMLEEQTGITVVEAKDISEAEGFLINGVNISSSRKPPSLDPINDSLPLYNSSNAFHGMAQGMIDIRKSSEARIDPALAKDEMLGPYFEQMSANENTLVEKGYYFSAANSAFLAYIDAETIANADSLDVQDRITQAQDCLASGPEMWLDEKNADWFAGEELRESWAQKKISEVESVNATLKDEKYLSYHEAMYADAWCRISKMLAVNAPQGGRALDESALKNLSEEYLRAARRMNSSDEDVIWHLENAETMHSEGKYAGAILDSVFVIEMENASVRYGADSKGAEAELENLSKEKRNSLWGDVYASHGAFVLWSGDTLTAYKLFRLAKGLDTASARAAADLGIPNALPSGAGQAPNAASGDLRIYIYAAALLLIALGAIVAYLYLVHGQDGATKQKKNYFKPRKRD